MLNSKISNFAKKLSLLILGSALVGLGVAFFVVSSLGVDTVSLLAMGVRATFQKFYPISVGSAILISHLIALTIIFLSGNRKVCNIGTYLAVVFISLFCNLFIDLIGSLSASPNLLLKISFSALGILSLATGIGFCIFAKLGASPLDLLPVVISNKTNIKASIVRIGADFSYASIGLILGGKESLGPTTFICVCLVGPIIAQTISLCNKHLTNWRDF